MNLEGKNIWIINEYAGSPKHGMEFRHYYLGKEFIKLGHKVSIISSSYSHLFKNKPKPGLENIDGISYLWFKTLNYGNSHNFKRIIKWFYFSFKILTIPFYLKKPDVILISPMAPFSSLPAWILSKLYNAKLIFEVKDIWPLSIIEIGGYNKCHPFIYLMSLFEKFALSKSDFIVSNLEYYEDHISNLGVKKKSNWISNGIHLEELFSPIDLTEEISSLIPKNKFIVGYTGTVGAANAIECLLEAAKNINVEDIFFVVVGDGREKQLLKQKFSSLKNIVFIDSIDKNKVQSMLSLFDVCYLGWNKKDIYQYGTSANKIFDYMYSGKPILNSFSGKGDHVQKANCGVSVEAKNIKEIIKGITKLHKMSSYERLKLGENGNKYVIKHFSYANLASKYDLILQK